MIKPLTYSFTGFRFWLLKKLFTEDEKYLINRAIEDRIDDLRITRVNEPWVDVNNLTTDFYDYLKLRAIFEDEQTNRLT